MYYEAENAGFCLFSQNSTDQSSFLKNGMCLPFNAFISMGIKTVAFGFNAALLDVNRKFCQETTLVN